MGPLLRQAFEEELRNASRFAASGDLTAAFGHLERAHVLGQRSTRPHMRAHWEMLRVGWRRHDAREVLGQITRLAGAAVLTHVWVPAGNTGGASVGAFAEMPIPEDLRRLLDG